MRSARCSMHQLYHTNIRFAINFTMLIHGLTEIKIAFSPLCCYNKTMD